MRGKMVSFVPENGVNRARASAPASGPERRTMAMPASPGAVAMAAMVLSFAPSPRSSGESASGGVRGTVFPSRDVSLSVMFAFSPKRP